MTYRTIAVHVNGSRHTAERVKLAARLAVSYEAHLVGVAASALPQAFYMGGMAGEGAAALNAYLHFMKERTATSLALFESIADRAGVSSFEKRTIDDEAGVALSLQARYSDLLILGQNDPDEKLVDERTGVPEYVLLNGGRPVLIVPYAGEFDGSFDRVLIGWDGSFEASRAVTGAIPILQKAKVVEVAVFNPKIGPGGHGEEPGADIALYLARHGVNVEVSQQRTGDEIDVGNAILSHIADVGSDLIVMGGYGHSRLREALLGGATRTVLEAMTVPVLMSH